MGDTEPGGGDHQKWVQAYVVEKASHTTAALFCGCNLWYFKSPLISLGYYQGMRGNSFDIFQHLHANWMEISDEVL